MMDFLVKFAQIHESFRKAEIEALAVVEGLDMVIKEYDPDSPHCIVTLPSVDAAKRLIRRSILAQSIHELWGSGTTMDGLHESIKQMSSDKWPVYKEVSFKFDIEPFRGARSKTARLQIINSFPYLNLTGPIKLSDPDELFTVFEVWPFDSVPLKIENPYRMYLGRFIATSSRDSIHTFDLKKRGYIATTSMDSELSLVTANIALAAPGKLFYDPFVGTGSFPVACAFFGAITWGSDIDGRSMRGDGGKRSLRGNFEQYGLHGGLGDVFSADLTNTPLRMRRVWDGIVCDPPYGVREGLKVLGCRDPEKTPWVVEAGIRKHRQADYVPPKKPYSFLAMLDNILDFAAKTLVDHGRVSFWMPTANDADQEIPEPSHPCLQVVVVCHQVFTRWSRKLITYRRLPDDLVSKEALEAYLTRQTPLNNGKTADDLNPFRRGYFKGFEPDEET